MEKLGSNSDGEEMVMSIRDLSKCPIFSGKEEDYEEWRVLVDNWIDMEGENCGGQSKARHCVW